MRPPEFIYGADLEEAVKRLHSYLGKRGIFIYPDPAIDTIGGYGFIHSEKPLNPENLKKVSDEFWAEELGYDEENAIDALENTKEEYSPLISASVYELNNK